MEKRALWTVIEIDGTETNYEVSDDGRVRNSKTQRQLKQVTTKRGYKRVTFKVGKKAKSLLVHRLVATAFIPNSKNLPQVNHLDEDKTNNLASNLQWVTAKQNINHSLNSRSGKRSKLPREIVLSIVEKFKSGLSQTKIAKYFGITQICVGYILSGKTYSSITGIQQGSL